MTLEQLANLCSGPVPQPGCPGCTLCGWYPYDDPERTARFRIEEREALTEFFALRNAGRVPPDYLDRLRRPARAASVDPAYAATTPPALADGFAELRAATNGGSTMRTTTTPTDTGTPQPPSAVEAFQGTVAQTRARVHALSLKLQRDNEERTRVNALRSATATDSFTPPPPSIVARLRPQGSAPTAAASADNDTYPPRPPSIVAALRDRR